MSDDGEAETVPADKIRKARIMLATTKLVPALVAHHCKIPLPHLLRALEREPEDQDERDALIAQAVAEGRVTKCPPAYAGAVQGGAPERTELDHYETLSWTKDKHRIRGAKNGTISSAGTAKQRAARARAKASMFRGF